MHARAGFRHVGTFRSVGFKFGRWVDTVLMQRPLGPGDDGAPPDPDGANASPRRVAACPAGPIA